MITALSKWRQEDIPKASPLHGELKNSKGYISFSGRHGLWVSRGCLMGLGAELL